MGAILGSWTGYIYWVFTILLAVVILTCLNHKNFSGKAREIRNSISMRVAEEVVTDKMVYDRLVKEVRAIPAHNHTVGVDAPLSQEKNLDTPYLETAAKVIEEGKIGNGKIQEFRTLYHQMMLPMTMRNLLAGRIAGAVLSADGAHDAFHG